MSAIEWFSFISPFFWILLVLNALTLFPVPFKKVRITLRLHLSIVISLVIALLGWLMALSATHITTPIIRVNVLQGSQVILIPTLLILSVTLVLRFIQGKHLLNLMFHYLWRFLFPILNFMILFILPFLFQFLIKTFSHYTKNTCHNNEEADQKTKGLPTNWRGDYIGKSKRHKY